MAAPPSVIHGLEREDRVTKLRTYSRYVMVLLIVIMFLMVIDSIRQAGVMIMPFYMPLASFLFIILEFALIANVVIIIVDALELNWTPDLRKKVWRADDFMVNSRPVVVITIVMAILFSSQAIPGLIADFGTTTGSENVDGLGSYRVKFSPTDPVEVSRISRIDVTSDRGPVAVMVILESDFSLFEIGQFDLNNATLARAVKWSGGPAGINFSGDLGARSLDFAEYALVFYNPSNETVSVHYKLANEASASFLSTLVLLCIVFFALNLAWAISVFAMKRRFVGEFIHKEQQRLMRTYTIEEVFLIYKDGRLICHNTRRLKPDLDKDVLTGMLTAVQSFVRDSFAGEEKGVLNELKYGNLKILMENGPRANLAVVIAGTEPASLRLNMRALLTGIHQKYMPLLDDWDGDTGTMKELKRQIGQLIPEERHRERTEVEEILLLYRDNRFMMHLSQRGQPDVDDSLLNQLLDTVKERVGQNLAASDTNPLNEIPYGNWKVVLEYGVQVYLAALISDVEPPDLRGRMRSVLEELASKFDNVLQNWDGNTQRLSDLKPVLETLFVESLKKAKGKKK